MRKLNEIVVVTGVSASGKDYLLSRAIDTLPEDYPVTPVAFGSEIHALMMQQDAACDSRDNLRELPADMVRRFAKEVICRIQQAEGTTILNTHVAYRQGDLVVSDPATDMELRARDYIFVAADPEEIVRRREADDRVRSRKQESAEMVAVHQEIALATVAAITKVLKSGLTVIGNRIDNTPENIAEIRRVIMGEAIPEQDLIA